MKDKDGKVRDVEDPINGNNLCKKDKSKPPLTKTAGLEAVINISSALKKYEEAVTPSNEDFLLWR
jgi:hypothetical protein